MIIYRFLIFVSLVLPAALLSLNSSIGESHPINIQKPQQFTITESFTIGTKNSYEASSVNLETGRWIFDNALIGELPADKKNGARAARIKAGSIAMDFDIYNTKKVFISHAIFGKDKEGSFEFLVSTDQGKSFKRLGKEIKSSNEIKLDSFINPFNGKIRIKILSLGASRLNISDIIFKGVGNHGFTIKKETTTPIVAKKTGSVTNTLSSRMVMKGKDAPPGAGENSNLYFGNPSNASFADSDNYLMDKYYYTESYNRTKGTPNWVSWHLDKSNITSTSGRVNNFAAYAGLPSGWYQVQGNSYAESGFDRGHNCPSGDRTSSRNANLSTFLMTNMIPQAPQNNQKPWADFEVYLREQVKKGYEVYIIMGVYGVGGSGLKGRITSTIDNGRVTVPSNIWKVALILPEGDNDLQRAQNSEVNIIAINTPNTNVVAADWRRYLVSVREIENATGYNLLSALPKKIQDKLETGKATIFK